MTFDEFYKFDINFNHPSQYIVQTCFKTSFTDSKICSLRIQDGSIKP